MMEVFASAAIEAGKEVAKESVKELAKKTDKIRYNPDQKIDKINFPAERTENDEIKYDPDQKIDKINFLAEKTENDEIKGGSYNQLKEAGHDHSHNPPEEKHHVPSWEAMGEATEIKYEDCPAIAMETADHRQTASWGSSAEAREYRAEQARLIKEGKFDDALQMDIDDIREKFGNKYDSGIEQMQDYVKKLKEENHV